MGRYFGADGFRGEVNISITPMHAYKIGRFLGWYSIQNSKINHSPRILIGMDTRQSSEMLEAALIAGITSSGVDVYNANIIPTAGLAYLTKNESFNYGIMITASHNPYYDNGIKIFTHLGEKIDDKLIMLIEGHLENLHEDLSIPLAHRNDIGRSFNYRVGRKKYIDFLSSKIQFNRHSLRIGLDCANGASYDYVQNIFQKFGAYIEVINKKPNGRNINKNCGAIHIDCLRNYVQKEHLDVGFAFDGDSDRCIAIDEEGNTLDGDQILYVLANYLKANCELEGNTVIATIMSNSGLVASLKEVGIECILSSVGDRSVYEYMINHGYYLGGEKVGHIILRKYATTGDGLLTAIMILNAMQYFKSSLFSLVKPMKKIPQVCHNMYTENKLLIIKNKSVQERVESIQKAIGKSGRVVLRASGIENVIRILVECESLELCKRYVEYIEEACVNLL